MDRQTETLCMMMHTVRMHRRQCERLVSEMGLHHSQHRMLMHLALSGNTPSQKELAKHFNISPAAVAVMIKKLEDGGYVRRNSTINDQRVNLIEITASGRDVVDRSREYFDSIEECMFKGISDKDISTFRRCLEKMQNNFTEFEEKNSI